MNQQRKNYKPDDLVVNYHDACIYGRDLMLVERPHEWLNASVIHFHMMQLQQAYPKFLFLDPSVVSFLMHQCDDEDLEEYVQSNGRFQDKERLFIPINDTHQRSEAWHMAQGNHWSLLLVLLDEPSNIQFYHFDSMMKSSGNRAAARDVAERFQQMLSFKHCSVVECNVPQQTNGYDCGLHALASTRALVQMMGENTKEGMEQAVAEYLEEHPCSELRRQIAHGIRTLANDTA